MITAATESKRVTRNISHFKKCKPEPEDPEATTTHHIKETRHAKAKPLTEARDGVM